MDLSAGIQSAAITTDIGAKSGGAAKAQPQQPATQDASPDKPGPTQQDAAGVPQTMFKGAGAKAAPQLPGMGGGVAANTAETEA